MPRAGGRALTLATEVPRRSLDLARRTDLLWIEAKLLTPDSNQPRRTFDEETFAELSADIRDRGILQPLLARPPDPRTGVHVITDGERRWRAGVAAGVDRFPCLVDDADPATAHLQAFLANLHRDALTPMDTAMAMAEIRSHHRAASDEALATLVHKSVPWVRRMLAAAQLDAQTRTALAERNESPQLAIGLRPQTPSERRRTLAALDGLPHRDAKMRFVSRVNELRRDGAEIEEAIEEARRDRGAPRAASRREAGGAAFVWSDGDLRVSPGRLATSRLSRGGVGVDAYAQALQADLEAALSALAGAPEGSAAAQTLRMAIGSLGSGATPG